MDDKALANQIEEQHKGPVRSEFSMKCTEGSLWNRGLLHESNTLNKTEGMK